MILTDNTGRPLCPPDPPALDANIEDKIAYLRASAAYTDMVASLAHRAFDKAFRKAMRRYPGRT